MLIICEKCMREKSNLNKKASGYIFFWKDCLGCEHLREAKKDLAKHMREMRSEYGIRYYKVELVAKYPDEEEIIKSLKEYRAFSDLELEHVNSPRSPAIYCVYFPQLGFMQSFHHDIVKTARVNLEDSFLRVCKKSGLFPNIFCK